MTIVEEGDEVLIPDPGFVAYPTIVRMAGGVPVFYRLPAASDFAFDAADFRRRVSPRTKAVVLISPSNPTGRVLTDDDMAAMPGPLAGKADSALSEKTHRGVSPPPRRPP